MAITTIRNSTFIADAVNYIKNKLNTNITDPLSGGRPPTDKFILTEYPMKPVKYPIITVKDAGSAQEMRLGMRSESTMLRIPIEIRIWTRNVVERDELFDSVYDYLRTNQFSGDDFQGAELHDFKMSSAVNVSEGGTRSKVMEVSYLFIAE